MKLKTSIFTLWLSAAVFTAANAEAPKGYYNSCENLGGRNLLSELQDVIDNHHNVGYDGLWDVYADSDVRDNGTIWDMYSTKQWVFGKSKCGNYKSVGDCYNREHSMPKSWFSEGSPMKSDAFHVYPTDGKVNGQRSNYPYGECEGGKNLGTYNGVTALGRLGRSTFEGYSGTVFEPIDEYKGDFARTYFYMAARYNDKISSWKSDMLAHNSYPAFSSWAVKLLLKWHRQDPVSEKERDRNDAVYKHQKNRNPFIDHPEMAEYIWGDKSDQRWSSTSSNLPELNAAGEIKVIPTISGVEISVSDDARIPVAIYSVDGTCRFNGHAAGHTSFSLPRGIYIINANGTAHRISVK